MATVEKVAAEHADRQWHIVGRWQEYEGEARANLLRMVGILVFYLVEMANYYGLQLGVFEMPKTVDKSFHQAVTALAVAWALLCLLVQFCLMERFFPSLLKFFSTFCDIVLLTAVLAVASGPKSPLIVGYFLILSLAALRFSLRLVWMTAIVSAGGYLFLLGYTRWFTNGQFSVPRYHQIIFLLAISLLGVVLGQVIRRVRTLADDYATRLERNRETPP